MVFLWFSYGFPMIKKQRSKAPTSHGVSPRERHTSGHPGHSTKKSDLAPVKMGEVSTLKKPPEVILDHQYN